jgi:excisionase family DNA binding protein
VSRSAPSAGDGLFTTFEVAARLRIRPQGVRELALRQELPYYRIGRKMLFSAGDLEAFLACRRRAKD